MAGVRCPVQYQGCVGGANCGGMVDVSVCVFVGGWACWMEGMVGEGRVMVAGATLEWSWQVAK